MTGNTADELGEMMNSVITNNKNWLVIKTIK